MDLKLLFSGFIQLYYYWEVIAIISLLAVVLNSFYSLAFKKAFTFFYLRLTIFTLVFNLFFFLIGIFIYLLNLLLLFWNKKQDYIIDQNYDLFFFTPHILNLFSIVIITIGWSLQKKSNIDSKKFFRLFIFWLSGLLILVGKYLYLK